MLKYVAQRFVALIPVLIGISIATFILIRLIPGDVVDLILSNQVQVGEAAEARLRDQYGLNEPIYVQYFDWAAGVVQGDLGNSLRTGNSVLGEIMGRLPTTVELTVIAMLFAIVIAVPAGIIAAVRVGTRIEAAVQGLGLLGLSMPNFWLGTLLILVTSQYMGWFPASSYVSFTDDPWQNIQIFILPGIALGAAYAAVIMRMTRSSLLEVLHREYVMAARARGVRERVVILRHALKNALIPVVTVIGIQIGRLLGGTIIIEQLFNLPGIGRLAIDAILERDYPMIQGVVLFIAIAFVIANLLVDLLYAYLDPRIRYT